MQPWSYNNSRRLDFASAIHRIYTPMTQWTWIPFPISWSVQLNIDLYINTWAFFAGPSDFVTVIDVRRPLRWERGRPRSHDYMITLEILLSIKSNVTALENTLIHNPRFLVFFFLLTSWIMYSFTLLRALPSWSHALCTDGRTDRQTYQLPCTSRHQRQSLVPFHVILSVYYQVLIL